MPDLTGHEMLERGGIPGEDGHTLAENAGQEEGRLKTSVDAVELVRALFPAEAEKIHAGNVDQYVGKLTRRLEKAGPEEQDKIRQVFAAMRDAE